jgi:hypothetical protein
MRREGVGGDFEERYVPPSRRSDRPAVLTD